MKIFVNKFRIRYILKSAFLILYTGHPVTVFLSIHPMLLQFFDLFSLRIYFTSNRKSRNYPLNCLLCAIPVYLGQTNEIVYSVG